MIWKDAHSKLSEEKHIAKQCGIVTFLFKKKKESQLVFIQKSIWKSVLQGVNGCCF